MADLLRREIESRYPETERLEEKKEEPSPENAAQIAPLNQDVDPQEEALAPQQDLGQIDVLQAPRMIHSRELALDLERGVTRNSPLDLCMDLMKGASMLTVAASVSAFVTFSANYAFQYFTAE